jgi:DNA gyrase subunit A
MGVDDGDELIACVLTDGKKQIFMATHEGMAIVFKEDDVRDMGRAARGVRGITLRDNDYVVGVTAVSGGERMLSISSRGFGKRTELSEYRLQGRGGSGVINMKVTDKIGKVIAVMPVTDEAEIMLITQRGKLIRLEASKIRETGRSAQGVKLIETTEDDLAASATLIESANEELLKSEE